MSKAYVNVIRTVGASIKELSGIVCGPAIYYPSEAILIQAQNAAIAQLKLRCDSLETLASQHGALTLCSSAVTITALGPTVEQFWSLFPTVDPHDPFKAEITRPVYQQLHQVAVLPFSRSDKGFSLVAPIGKVIHSTHLRSHI